MWDGTKSHLRSWGDFSCQHRSCQIWNLCNSFSGFLNSDTCFSAHCSSDCHFHPENIVQVLSNFAVQRQSTVVTWESGRSSAILIFKSSVNELSCNYRGEHCDFHRINRFIYTFFLQGSSEVPTSCVLRCCMSSTIAVITRAVWTASPVHTTLKISSRKRLCLAVIYAQGRH